MGRSVGWPSLTLTGTLDSVARRWRRRGRRLVRKLLGWRSAGERLQGVQGCRGLGGSPAWQSSVQAAQEGRGREAGGAVRMGASQGPSGTSSSSGPAGCCCPPH